MGLVECHREAIGGIRVADLNACNRVRRVGLGLDAGDVTQHHDARAAAAVQRAAAATAAAAGVGQTAGGLRRRGGCIATVGATHTAVVIATSTTA